MAIGKGEADAGSGGKRGHSNQNHWIFTEELKTFARKRRRLDAKREIRDELAAPGGATKSRKRQRVTRRSK